VPKKSSTKKASKPSTTSGASTGAKKKTAKKKSPARKSTPRAKKKTTAATKASSRKKASTAKKKPAAKKKAPPRKKAPAAKKAPATKAAPKGRRVAEAVKKQGEAPVKKATQVTKGKPLTKRELKQFQKLLLELRERLQGDIRFLTTDNLHRAGRETGADLSGAAQHSADHGTDNFDREFALSLASTEQDVLYEVDEALMRIEDGEYGVCELTGVQIERARLEVIPYTRYSVQAQAKMEQSRAQYRPFSQTFKGW